VNPMGKLPALVHRGTVVTEAGAICAYLADAFPAAGLRVAQMPGNGNLLSVDVLWCGLHRAGAHGSDDATACSPETQLQWIRLLRRHRQYAGKGIDARALHLGDRFSAADVYIDHRSDSE